jgi:hypothetical protein
VSGDDDWWLRSSTPSSFINRRWRKQRPGDLHPRRRASDKDEGQDGAPEPEDPFDPATLFRTDPATQFRTDPPTQLADERPTSEPVEPWATLGLRSNATWDQIVVRHRELAKLHHPDRIGPDDAGARDAADRMATINGAFAELGRIYRITGDR